MVGLSKPESHFSKVSLLWIYLKALLLVDFIAVVAVFLRLELIDVLGLLCIRNRLLSDIAALP